jgi:hypothetical protein
MVKKYIVAVIIALYSRSVKKNLVQSAEVWWKLTIWDTIIC